MLSVRYYPFGFAARPTHLVKGTGADPSMGTHSIICHAEYEYGNCDIPEEDIAFLNCHFLLFFFPYGLAPPLEKTAEKTEQE